MAFGFPASYSTQVDLIGNREAARNAVESTLETMGWEYSVIDPNTFIARVPYGGGSWGETVTITLADGSIEIRSACYFQVIDWGKNRRNVDNFLGVFSSREMINVKIFSNEPIFLDEDGKSPIERMLMDEDQKRV